MQRINFYLADPQVTRLREKSGLTGLSTSELVRRAIDAYLDGQPVPGIAATSPAAPARANLGSRRRRPDPATRAERIAALAVDEEGPRDFDPESGSQGGVATLPEVGHVTSGRSNRPPSPQVPAHSAGDTTRDDVGVGEGEDENQDGDDDGGEEGEAEDLVPDASIRPPGAADPVSSMEAAHRLDLAEKIYTTEVYSRARFDKRGEDEVALGVLRNPTISSLSPLFRYCVALGMAAQLDGDLAARFEELATRFEAAAVQQYGGSPAAYDRAWGNLIPDRLRYGTGRDSGT